MPTVNTNDPIEVARINLTEALAPFFKGRGAPTRLENAVNAAIDSVQHLIQTTPTSNTSRLGATVMTEAASMRNKVTKKHHTPPRNL